MLDLLCDLSILPLSQAQTHRIQIMSIELRKILADKCYNLECKIAKTMSVVFVIAVLFRVIITVS